MFSNLTKPFSIFSNTFQSANKLVFYVNNKRHEISNPGPDSFLVDYIRNDAGLKGTKVGCGIGECGACTVVASRYDPIRQDYVTQSLNSCCVPLCSVDGWSILTIEGLSKNEKELHPIQEEIIDNHGVQCGFCTPGITMSIYSSLKEQEGKNLDFEKKMKKIEKDLSGNICRCTGYRPILTAAENMVKNPEKYSQDIFNFPKELEKYLPQYLEFEDPETKNKWYSISNLDQLLEIKRNKKNVHLVYGNSWLSAQCKERCDHRDSCSDCTKKWGNYVFASNVPELRKMEENEENIFIGSQNSITEIQNYFKVKIGKDENSYKLRGIKSAVEMMDKFENKQKRNGSSLTEAILDCHPQNDINTLLVGLGAKIVLINTKKEIRKVKACCFFRNGGPKGKTQFRRVDKKKDEVIMGVEIPFTEEYEFVKIFKQSRRRENDQAIVNACFRISFKKKEDQSFEIKNVNLSLGGVSITTACAKSAEKYLIGRNDFDSQICMNEVLRLLQEEFSLEKKKVFGGMEKYRSALMISFYYKFYLYILNEIYGKINSDEKSAIENLCEKVSSGTQTFDDPLPRKFPIGIPHPMLQAQLHASGQSEFVDDSPKIKNELEGVLVLSRKPHAKIKKIDASKALKMKGVVGFITSKDVPKNGSNDFALVAKDEKVFFDDIVTAYGQCVGLIVAEDKKVAQMARDAVKIEYEDIGDEVLTIDEALEKKSFLGEPHTCDIGDADKMFLEMEKNKDKYLVLQGKMNVGGQEHMYLEPQSTRVIPAENDEIKIYSATQNVSEVQRCVASVLGIPRNRVVCFSKRMGGAYGGKEEKPSILSTIAAVAAYKLKRPVRLVLDRFTDMTWSGQRHAYLTEYKIGIDKETKKIMAIDLKFWNNGGFSLDLSENVIHKSVSHCNNSYHIPNCKIFGMVCKSNTSSNTAFRGFGAPQAMVCVDQIIDNLAHDLGISANELREKNFYKEGDITPFHQVVEDNLIPQMWEDCKKISNFEERKKQVNDFNKLNKWVKRGIYMTHVKYATYFSETRFLNQGSALVCAYRDGSVVVSHGGTEMGQGLYTKIAQICAHELDVPLSSVYIQDTASDKTPNVSPTAASSGCDINGAAVKNACDKLNERLTPIRERLGPNAKFADICNEAYLNLVSLSATGYFVVPKVWFNKEKGIGVFPYFTHGVACSEVEVDVLTGDYKVLQTDIVMDVGRSINPGVDIGQIEGAFTQALGLFTMEELVKGDKSHPWLKKGKFWSNSPAKYKIPTFNDAPSKINVHLLKKTPNSFAIHGSKAIGEPSLYLGSSVYFAIKEAIRASREENGNKENFQFDTPATAERIRMACGDSLVQKVLGDETFKYRVEGTW